jgi:drug/metabolite transporter (DMT)-like permease
MGFLLVFISALSFCFQNVIVRVLFTQQTLLGVWSLGGYVTPTLQHSFLLMLMRTLWVVPLMALLAGKLYPPAWQELGQLRLPANRRLLWQSLGCGGLMFSYLALLYIAIGLIPTGIVLTLFFTYPLFTALLSWLWFGQRPGLFRYAVMALVIVGTALTVPRLDLATNQNVAVGVALGIASGFVFACYTVIAQRSFSQIHPVPFTWLSFATTLALSALSLLIWPLPTADFPWLPLWIGGLLSAVFTFGGHLLNNLGIQRIGAADAAIVAAANPSLTVILAWVAIQETLSTVQILGVVIVTLSVILLSQEKRFLGRES